MCHHPKDVLSVMVDSSSLRRQSSVPLPTRFNKTPSCLLSQKSHTQANRHHTATTKPSQTFHPTPVFSAILSILRIVPFSLTLVLSKLSFILSASADESRISSPIAMVSCLSWPTLEERTLVFSFSFCDSRDSRTE